MWLLPYLSAVSGAAVRLYYRASRSGGTVPATGPVLLVSNHPNSLLDPAFVAWAAERPVRFLAKAPLFTDKRVGWLVRGSGSLPVYRRQDDASQMGRNVETFRAVHDALRTGSAVALFPEGKSHSEPGLAALKTGAARIALGAVAGVGHAFPIIPIGLVFRAKDRFRSGAHVVVGAPIAWDDLATCTDSDPAAVRELTERIDKAIRAVTLNLARWEDEPVVRTAEAVWSAERNADGAPAARVERLSRATAALANLRANGDERWAQLANDVEEHARNLAAFGISAADVQADVGLGAAARWTLQRLRLRGILQFVVAALAAVLFWIPYRGTVALVRAMAGSRDVVSTFAVLGGAAVFAVWIVALSCAAWLIGGWQAGLAALVALPALAVAGLYCIERWQRTLLRARRWLILRRRGEHVASLRVRQQELARRLEEAVAAHDAIS